MAKIISGINDFETLHPEAMVEWDYEKNIGIDPKIIGPSSKIKAWWKCHLNHSYDLSIGCKSKGMSCPYCSNHRVLVGFNDLAHTKPELLKEWNYEKNIVAPTELTYGSGTKVWWKCNNCLHEWQADPIHRVQGRGCPECAKSNRTINRKKNMILSRGSIVEKFPLLLEEWDYSYNNQNEIDPSDCMAGSHREVGWVCKQCGEKWIASIASRTRGTGCPKCGASKAPVLRVQAMVKSKGELFSHFPYLEKEWDYEKNNLENVSPDMVTVGSDKIVWWICEFGHSYKSRVNHRTNGIGCPICARELQSSFPEQTIFYYIKQAFFEAVNGDRIQIAPYELDIYIPEVSAAIEYDGQAWHKDLKKDTIKTQKCIDKNIKLFRVRETECPAIEKTDGVMVYTYQYGDTITLGHIIGEILKQLTNKVIDVDIKRDSSQIYAQYVFKVKQNSIAAKNPELVKEWDTEKNGALKPDYVSYGSTKKVWWLCNKGHSYSSTPANRANGNSCPYCVNKKLLQGFNDLQTLHPEIAAEWNYQRNGEITPQWVLNGATIKVWWVCSLGHEWQATVNSRVSRKSGCPVCSHRIIEKGYSDLETINPEILKEWDYEKNQKIGISPSEIGIGSRKKAWWICSLGHSYQCSTADRSKGNGYSYCSGKKVLPGFNDLEFINPLILSQWNYRKNAILPSQITIHSNKKVWWICENGHEWEASVADRTRVDGKASNCPICCGKIIKKGVNDLATTHPMLLNEWDYEKNALLGIEPTQVSKGLAKKVWWHCDKGHVWEATIGSRTSGRGCPACGIDKMIAVRSKNILMRRGSFADNCPELLKEWHPAKNVVLPTEITKGSREKVWWLCSACGYEWMDTINHRLSGRDCPCCRKKQK